MHGHANQMNPNAQLDVLYAAEKAAAKQEAARTRKKLSEFAPKLAGESDSGEDCVVSLGACEESPEQTKRQNQPGQCRGKRQKEPPDSESGSNSISDWA
jgi:hypothetical protein